MPILRLEILTGRTPDQKRAFVREATRVAVETLECTPESLFIVIEDVERGNWASNGQLLSDR